MILHGINLHLNQHVGGSAVIPITSSGFFIDDEFNRSGDLFDTASSPVAGPAKWTLWADAGSAVYTTETTDGGRAYSTNVTAPVGARQSISPYTSATTFTLTATLQVTALGSGNAVGINPRIAAVSPSMSLIWCFVRTQVNELQIWDYSSGTPTSLDSASYTAPTSTDIEMTSVNTSTTVSCDIDDGTTTLSLSGSSTNWTSGTTAGIMSSKTANQNYVKRWSMTV
jgi:hypothetical protein